MSDATTVLRWTAGPGSARSATFVMLRLCTVRRLRVVLPVFFIVLAVVFSQTIDHYYGPTTRWVWGVLYAAAYTVGLILFSTLLSYVQLRRALGARLRPGTEFAATWDEDSVLLSHPLAETRILLTAISRVRMLGDWTAFQQSGVKTWAIWPAPLFPDEEVARLRR